MLIDDLNDLVEKINVIAKGKNIAVFKTNDLGWLWSYDESGKRMTQVDVIEWREGEEWEEFIDTASDMKATTLYIDARKFIWTNFIEEIEDISDIEPSDIVKRRKQAETFRKYDGCVEHLIIAFRAEGAWHVYQLTTHWLPKRLELVAEPEEEKQEVEEYISEENLENLARKLALNPGFSKLKKKTDQFELGKRIFAKEDEKVLNNLSEIVARSRVIYQTEVSTPSDSKRIKSK